MGDRKIFSCLGHGGVGLEVPPISIPSHASGVANVSTANAIVSSDGVNLSGADLHDSGNVSSELGLSSGGTRAVLLPGLAGDSRVYTATSVTVTGAADLHRFAQPRSVSLQFLNGVRPKMSLSDWCRDLLLECA